MLVAPKPPKVGALSDFGAPNANPELAGAIFDPSVAAAGAAAGLEAAPKVNVDEVLDSVVAVGADAPKENVDGNEGAVVAGVDVVGLIDSEAVEVAPNEKSKVLATLGLAGSGTLKPEDVVSLGFSVSGTELPEVFGASLAAPKAKLRDGWGCAVAEVVVVIAFDAVVTATDVGFEASTTFVTEVSPELIVGFGADDSPNAPNEKETDGAVSDLVSELVETASVAPNEKLGLADASKVFEVSWESVFCAASFEISSCFAFSKALSAISSSVSNAVSNFSTRFSSRLRSCSKSSFEFIRGLGEDIAPFCFALIDVLTMSDILGNVIRVPTLDGVVVDAVDASADFC